MAERGPARPERLAVVGSGAIGLGLARLAAPVVEVAVLARSADSAGRAREALAGTSARVVTAVEDLSDATLAIEAVAEDLEVKGRTLAALDAVLGPDAVVASTTSSLPVEALAAASGRPDRFGALHVFNPVERMALVELCLPAVAAAATGARLRSFATALGKEVVEVPDVPGFVVNRLLFPYMFSAVRLLEAHGLASEDIDRCMTLGAGHPMGPLALLDLVGLDVAVAIGTAIGEPVPERMTAMLERGELGRKTGKGFFPYSRESRERSGPAAPIRR